LKLRTLDEEPIVTAMKDPTRGGLANSLNEMATKSRIGILIEGRLDPIQACSFRGL